MRQLPRAPLESSTYSFISLQMRDRYEVGTKIGKYKTIRGENPFFFRDHHDFGSKIGKSEMKSK